MTNDLKPVDNLKTLLNQITSENIHKEVEVSTVQNKPKPLPEEYYDLSGIGIGLKLD